MSFRRYLGIAAVSLTVATFMLSPRVASKPWRSCSRPHQGIGFRWSTHR
jgi:hypothetical protein